jgi:hypothetical protein
MASTPRKQLGTPMMMVHDSDFTTPEDVKKVVDIVVGAMADAHKITSGRIDQHVSDSANDHANIAQAVLLVENKVDTTAQAIRSELKNVSLTKGDKGDKGEPGDDADEDRILISLLEKVKLPEQQAQLQLTKDTSEDIRNKLELLEGEERLDASAIKGLDKIPTKKDGELDFTRVAAANRPLWALEDVSVAGVTLNQSIKWDGQKWVPYTVGASSNITGLITPGTNITITGSGTSGSPYNISSTGGGVGSVIFYTPTGVVNASNAVFGVIADPSSVISDGIVYFEGQGFTYSAPNITLTIPPSEYIRYTL